MRLSLFATAVLLLAAAPQAAAPPPAPPPPPKPAPPPPPNSPPPVNASLLNFAGLGDLTMGQCAYLVGPINFEFVCVYCSGIPVAALETSLGCISYFVYVSRSRRSRRPSSPSMHRDGCPSPRRRRAPHSRMVVPLWALPRAGCWTPAHFCCRRHAHACRNARAGGTLTGCTPRRS